DIAAGSTSAPDTEAPTNSTSARSSSPTGAVGPEAHAPSTRAAAPTTSARDERIMRSPCPARLVCGDVPGLHDDLGLPAGGRPAARPRTAREPRPTRCALAASRVPGPADAHLGRPRAVRRA